MARGNIYEDVTDTQGNALAGILVTVYETGTLNLATLYDAVTGGNLVNNPLTTDSQGVVQAYTETGEYDLSVAAPTGTFVKPAVTVLDSDDVQAAKDSAAAAAASAAAAADSAAEAALTGMMIDTVAVTEGQTVVNVPFDYEPNTSTLIVTVNGSTLSEDDFSEATGQITTNDPLPAGTVTFFGLSTRDAGVTTSANVSHKGGTVHDVLERSAHFDNIAEAKLATGYAAGDVIHTNGYTTAGDGGGAKYKAVAAGTHTDGVGGQSADGSFLEGQGVQWELVADGAPNVAQFGAVGDGVADDADAIQNAINFLPSTSAGFFGGGEMLLPEKRYGVSKTIFYPDSNITLRGENSLSSVLVPLVGFTGSEVIRIDPIDHPSFVIYRNCSVVDIGFDHAAAADIKSITANSLNDGCEFRNIRSWNFEGTVLQIGKSARVGALLSQGFKVDSWNAITTADLVDDVFIIDEANEGLLINNKALGLSSGVSTAVGFHIGKNALAQGITLIGNSAAHLPNGTGIRFNTAERCWAYSNTLENVLFDIHIGHDTTAASCLFVEAFANRHYPTIGNPSTDITIGYAQSCSASLRENGTANITVNALNCEVKVATNRTSGTTLPTSITLDSTSSVVHETHKNGTAVHHAHGSYSLTYVSAGVFDMQLSGGGSVRGDATRISVNAGSGKAARLLSNGGSVEATSTGGITVNSAASQQVAIQENGTSKILLDGSGRVRVFGLSTTVPAVSDALYKDGSGFVKIT